MKAMCKRCKHYYCEYDCGLSTTHPFYEECTAEGGLKTMACYFDTIIKAVKKLLEVHDA